MMRLYLYVEGQTEQQYAHSILRDHLSRYNVFLEGAILAATHRRHGVIFRGGGRHFSPMRNDLARLLHQHHGRDVRFTTMFDLYKLCSDFPGAEASHNQRHLPYERVKILESALAAEMMDSRLIPYIQLHEFESILYCDLSAFEIHYANCGREIDALAKEAKDLLATPELINDGQHSAPSKRIQKQFPDYADAKPGAPVEIATMIELPVIRQKCPHFNDWLTRLEALGSV